MCVTEIYIDRFPDSSEVEFRRTRLCQYGRPGRPCELHSTLENTPRCINWGEPTSEFLLSQMNTPPRSSTSSGRASLDIIREVRDGSPRPRRRRRPDFLMSAFFGNPPHRRRGRRDDVLVINGPPSPAHSPRSPRTPPQPAPRVWEIPSSTRTPDPYVYEASPTRGRRQGPAIVIDNNLVNGQRQRRASSVQAQVGGRTGGRQQSRSPSPTMADIRREDAERERERRYQRDLRAARLEEELRDERERRRRDERRALHDAEINSRPPVPPAPQPLRHRRPFFAPAVDQSNRLHEILDDLSLNARGERVIAEAVAERRREESRREERERMIRAGIEAQDAEEQRARLRRRFTIGTGLLPRRRDRVMYDDGSYHYG